MNYQTIISVDELARLIDSDGLSIFDCRFSLKDPQAGLKSYQQGHIPGALFANMDTDLSSAMTPGSGRHPLPDAEELVDKLGKWGVDNSTQVIVYDDMSGAFAARLWWLLRWLGHKNVAVLDGGLPKWVEAGHRLETETPKVEATNFTASVDNSLHVDIDFVVDALDQNSIALFDARSYERFTGKDQNTDPVPGHVPGAVSMPFAENLTSTGYFRSPEELRERFSSTINRSGDREMIAMCGSGVTACHNLLAMQIAGLEPTRLFVGSWSQWIKSKERPVATGD